LLVEVAGRGPSPEVLQRGADEYGREQRREDGRPYRPGAGSRFEPVDLEALDDGEVRQLARSSIYTWEFTNLVGEDTDSAGDPSLAASAPARAPATGGDRPPDDAD